MKWFYSFTKNSVLSRNLDFLYKSQQNSFFKSIQINFSIFFQKKQFSNKHQKIQFFFTIPKSIKTIREKKKNSAFQAVDFVMTRMKL